MRARFFFVCGMDHRLVLTRSVLDESLVLLGLLPDVRDEVEEAANDRRSSFKLTHSVDERALKVGHDFDGPVEHRHPPRGSQPLDEVEETLVNCLCLPLH